MEEPDAFLQSPVNLTQVKSPSHPMGKKEALTSMMKLKLLSSMMGILPVTTMEFPLLPVLTPMKD